MHFRASQGFLIGNLPSGHLYQRRAGKKDLSLPLDHDHIVGHATQVGPTGGRTAENYRDGGDALLRPSRDLAETPSPSDEDFGLYRQIGPGGLHQYDSGQVVDAG